jgi:nucleoside-diphosphate-sugar epimerase
VRAIVLGASGFIGRWIARTLPTDADVQLVVRDSNSSSKIFSVFNCPGTLAELDLTDFPALEKFIVEVRPSIVFNLAGYGIDPHERDAHLYREINVELPRKLCDILRVHHDPDWKGQQLMHAGSALEYGTLKGVLAEDLTPQPTTAYGISKLAGTSAVLKSELRTCVARMFNVYGPGEHEGRLLPSLLQLAGNEEHLDLTAGTQRRDFTYVEDVALGLLKLGLLSQKFREPVNVATGKLHTVREFAEIAARILGISTDRLHFGKRPFRKEEMDHDGVSVDRLQELVQWTPSTTIEQGVKKTIAFRSSTRRD